MIQFTEAAMMSRPQYLNTISTRKRELLCQKLPPCSFKIKSIGLPTPSPEHCGSSKITFAFWSLKSVGSISVKSSSNNWISGKNIKKRNTQQFYMQANLPNFNVIKVKRLWCYTDFHRARSSKSMSHRFQTDWRTRLLCLPLKSLLMAFQSPVVFYSDCVLWVNQMSACGFD